MALSDDRKYYIIFNKHFSLNTHFQNNTVIPSIEYDDIFNASDMWRDLGKFTISFGSNKDFKNR